MNELLAFGRRHFGLERLKYLFLTAILLRYTLFVAVPGKYLVIKSVANGLQGLAIVAGILYLCVHGRELMDKRWFDLAPYGLFVTFYSITVLFSDHFSSAVIGGLLSYCVYIFVFGFSNNEKTYDNLKFKIKKINFFLIVATFAFSVCSIALYYSGITFIVTDILALGVIDGRFYGATGSPNKDAILAAISIIFTVMAYVDDRNVSKNVLAFYCLNLFFQVAVLSLGFSRGGVLFLFLFPLSFSFLLVLRDFKTKKTSLNSIKPIVFALIAIFGIKLSMTVTSRLLETTESIVEKTASGGEVLGRAEAGDLSSGRLLLWKSCAKVGKNNFWGVGFPNIDTECLNANPGKHLSGISAGMHNVFMQAWVGAGVFGLIATIAMLVHIVFKLWSVFNRTLNVRLENSSFLNHSIALLLSLLVYSLYENGPLFSHNIPSIIFWIYLGYINAIDRILLKGSFE